MSLDNLELTQGSGRVIVFDTETTGMNDGPGGIHVGHRIIEIGCLELVNRRPDALTMFPEPPR